MEQQDIKQILDRGMTVEQVNKQLEMIKNGFPFLKLQAAATVGNGIVRLDDEERKTYIEKWEKYKSEGHKITKFVPASGAASRMFKNLYAFLAAEYDVPTTDFEKFFFDNISHFAFYETLSDTCETNLGETVDKLVASKRYKEVVSQLLEKNGLNYGNLPKGLLLFYNYSDEPRTPMEEHLVEAALYASYDGKAGIHFTVSHDHLEMFKTTVAAKLPKYEKMFGIKYSVSFSEQKPSTDTIAANPDFTPFRNADGSLLFRPGGHGALIENLNEIHSDVVFIKNIDNVVPDKYKEDTTDNKKLLAGILVDIQEKIFNYLNILDNGDYNRDKLIEMIRFLQRTLSCRRNDIKELEDAELVGYLKHKFNRPLRVCGVVKNTGEAGGGPFLAYNQDGTVSAQILESSQIDKDNTEYMEMFKNGTHFNPVDLVCAFVNYKGKQFNLPDYVDESTGFVSSKSKDGKELLALEKPGLWNGDMSDWNTVCVEVPLSTFNPVKTVNDLMKVG